MKKLITLLMLTVSVYSFAQTSFYWRDPDAANANFDGGTGTANWWNGSAPQQVCGFGDIRFANNHYSGTMTNNISTGLVSHRIFFESGATLARQITSNNIRLYDNGGADPKIENISAASHSFTCLIEGDGDASDPLELNPVNGDLTFANIDNKGAFIKVYGSNSKNLNITGVLSGSGGLELLGTSKIVLSGANTYSGATIINVGEIEVQSGGTLGASSSDVTVKNGAILDIQEDVTINNLTVDSGATLTIASGKVLTVNGTLSLSQSITLGDGHILIGPSGSISGTFGNTNLIITSGSGTLRKNFSSTGSFLYPVGTSGEYTPVTLNFISLTGSSYAGVRSIASAHGSFIGVPPADYLKRNWVLTEGGFTSFSCDITCEYVQNDVVGTESNIYCGKWNGTSWLLGNATDTTNNKLTFNAAISFSDIAGAPPASLPVALLDFTARLNNNHAELAWSTASELNASHFNVHRSENGIDKQAIGVISAQGNSNEVVEYNFVDVQPINGQVFYFLEQVDFDGKTEWFGPVKVSNSVNNQADAVFGVNNDIVITLNGSLEMDRLEAKLFNMQGQLIKSTEFLGDQMSRELSVKVTDLPSGIYMLYLQSDNMEQAIKLVK